MESEIPQVERLKQAVASLLPGYLALFNMAESKRRNLHLGFLTVNEDIAALGTLLGSHLGSLDAYGHWGGDRWWAFAPRAHLGAFAAVAAAFSQSMPITAGWECRAIAPDGTERTSRERREVLLHRGVRCGYVAIQQMDDLEPSLEALQAVSLRLAVGQATAIADLENLHPAAWHSISEAIPVNWYCPFCSSGQLVATGGTDNTAEGQCGGCGAELDIRFF